jgi:dGTPase
VSYLRALAIGSLIDEVVEIFMTNEEEILNGNFSIALLDKSKYEAQINDIIKISIDKVYQSREVIEKEIAGHQVLNQLLSTFIMAGYNDFIGLATNYDKLILKVLPETVNSKTNSIYERLMAICLYISKLSDSNAILIHKKISGLQF